MQSVEVPGLFYFGVFANLSAMRIGTYPAGTVHNTVDSGTYPREIGPSSFREIGPPYGTYPREIGPPHFVKSAPP